MQPKLKTNNLAVIFLGTHIFGMYLSSGKKGSGKKSFKIYSTENAVNGSIFPKDIPVDTINRLSKSNIVVIPDISLLTISKKGGKDVSFSNDTIDDLYLFLNSSGVKNPVIISSLASIEILFHYYSKTLKFFPDDKTYILSGNDDLVFEARLRGRGLAAARLIDYDKFADSKHNYGDCDHLITFSSDPFAFRFEEELEKIENKAVSCGNEENFSLSENTEDGKSYKGIFNICEMVNDLYFTNSLPIPGLLTTKEQEYAAENLRKQRTAEINRFAMLGLTLLVIYFLYAITDLLILRGAGSELEEFKQKNGEKFEFVQEYGGKIKLIPESKSLLDSTKAGFVELSRFIGIIENYALDKNIQITKISLQPNKYIFIRGFTDSHGVISSFLEKFKGSKLLVSETLQSENEYYTAFKAIIPWGVK